MSEVLDTVPDDAAEAPGTRPGGLDGTGTWRVTWNGVRTVAVLELRQRVRSTRWIIVLILWGLLLGGMTLLLHVALGRLAGGPDDGADDHVGAIVFGLVVYLVLSLGSLIAPAMSSSSVNGDRAAGVLATLQTTLLTPAEIALGKLGAAWLTALAFLAVALPFIGWGYLDGGTPVTRLLVTLTLLAVMLLVVCAVGLGWSALTARTTSSAALTYLTVAFVGVGLPVLFLLFTPMVTTTENRQVRTPVPVAASTEPPTGTPTASPPMLCQNIVEQTQVTHSEWIWWLLAANPYVVLADASPKPAGADDGDDVLSGIRTGVRELRLGSPEVEDRCNWSDVADPQAEAREKARKERREALGVTWPYGLAANLALGAGFTVVTIRRLRAPARVLPRGTRVA